MSDTRPEAAEFYRRLLLSKSAAERLAMGADMFTTAKELALADLRRQGVRAGLFLRFYGHEFEPEERERILQRLRTIDAERPLPQGPLWVARRA